MLPMKVRKSLCGASDHIRRVSTHVMDSVAIEHGEAISSATPISSRL
jgi:hypothetical protein